VREVQRQTSLKPYEGACIVIIFDGAEAMSQEAANALLKTLEEPPAHALLILIASSWHALLPTIRSRCQAVPFQLVPRTQIVNYLVERRELVAEEAVLRAGLSGGRIGAALDLDLEEFRQRRDTLLSILDELARRGDPGLAVARAEAIVQAGDSVEGDLEILMTLLRDLLILGASPADEARLVNVDIAPDLRDRAAHFEGRAGDALESLEITIESIRQKGNRQLLVENFLMDLVPEAPGPRRAHART
jgi:DNA polymerase-3 subunit delta'